MLEHKSKSKTLLALATLHWSPLLSEYWLAHDGSLQETEGSNSADHTVRSYLQQCVSASQSPVGPFVLHEKGRIPSIPTRHRHTGWLLVGLVACLAYLKGCI